MKRKLFALLMLGSGFAGISYEILYGRILGNLIGDQFAVSAAILITFLLGIGIGSRFAWLLWPYLWLIEAAIGLCGAAFTFGTDALDALLYSTLPVLPTGLSGSIIACVFLLIIPAFLIGCSVPLFSGYMSRLASGAVFSWVYAVYNVGAALTALLIEYLLIRWFGIQGAMLGFVVLNLLIAATLRFGFDTIRRPYRAAADTISHISRRQWLGLIPVSMASAVFQLLMIKLAEMILGPFRESFALVLSIILIGIAAGSMLVRVLSLKFQTVLLIAMFGLLFLIAGVEPVCYLYAQLYDQAAEAYLSSVMLKWGCLALLMGIPSVAFGATIPALLQEKQGDVSRQSGQLLFVSSMANVAGFLLMVFFLHRYLDYGVQLLVISLLTTLSLLVYMHKQLRPVWIAGAIFLTTGAIYHQYWDEDLLYISYTNFRSVDDLDDARDNFDFPEKFKGYQDVFSINWMDGKPYFFINGYTSIPLNNPSEKVVGALSSIYAANTDDALVLGLGSGATASVVGQLFNATDVVEINPVVRENLFRMKRWNFDIEANPKVNIIVDDAIHYTKASRKKYDLILNTVTTPLYFSSAKLYTRDFFQVVKRRMHLDGIYVTWMDARVGDKGVDIILNTIAGSFRYCALLYVKSSYFLLICSDRPITAQQSERVNNHPVLHADFLVQHGILSHWLKYQLLHSQVLDLIADPNQPLNEANYPALEFEMARLRGRGIPDFKSRLRQTMKISDVQNAMDTISPAFPADLVMHTRIMLKNSSLTRRWESLAKSGADQYEALHSLALQHYYLELASLGAGADAYHKFGYQLMRSEKYEQALTVFYKVLEMDEEHNNTHFNMGACYEYLGDLPQALHHYEKEAELDPDDKDVPYRIGRVHVKMKSYKKALASLQSALERMGPDAGYRVYDYLGKAYEGLGRKGEAEVAYHKADDKRSKSAGGIGE
jgi:predicted membrane-bound spermidine synthase